MTKHTKAYLALIFICIVWGTTFLVIKIGVQYYPAFLFAGVRQAVAGTILAIAALIINKQKDLSRANILRQMLVGFLMLAMGNGLVSWGEKYIPSGVAALLCSLMPLFAVLLNLVSSKKEHFNMTIGTGLTLGIIGVGFIFRQNIADLGNTAYLAGMIATIIATCSWAVGSTINKKHGNPVNPFFNSGLQQLFGGLIMLVVSPFIEDYSGMQLWHPDGLLALAFLIIFGSVIAYAAYMYALSTLPVGVATLYAYVNPLIAVIVGYIFMNEPLNIYTAVAFITIVASVLLVNRGYRKQHRKDTYESKTVAAFPENMPAES